MKSKSSKRIETLARRITAAQTKLSKTVPGSKAETAADLALLRAQARHEDAVRDHYR